MAAVPGRIAPDHAGGRGERSVALAAHLLGLRHPARPGAAVRPVALFRLGDPPRVVVTLETAAGEADVFVEPRADGRPAMVTSAHLALGHAGPRCAPVVERVLRHAARRLDGAFVELGFPSLSWHAYHDAPFLGYRGALYFVDRLANALSAP